MMIIRTDRLELYTRQGPHWCGPIRHETFPDDPPEIVAAKLDALVANKYRWCCAEVGHAIQGAWWRRGPYPIEHDYDFVARPRIFVQRLAPTRSRRLRVLANLWPEGRRFDFDRRTEMLITFLRQVGPHVAGVMSKELDELGDGPQIMRAVRELAPLVEGKPFILHFRTGHMQPQDVPLRDFWRDGVSVRGERIPGVLTLCATALLMYQCPKRDGASSTTGFETTPAIIDETVKDHARSRPWLPIGYGEGCHLQRPGKARALAMAWRRSCLAHGVPWRGSLNG